MKQSQRLLFVMALAALILPFAGAVIAQSDVQATVIPDSLNVRAAPDGDILGVFMRNTVLRVSGREDDWNDSGLWVYATPVEGGLTGWVRSDYLTFPAGYDPVALPVVSGMPVGAPAAPEGDQAAVAPEAPPPPPMTPGVVPSVDAYMREVFARGQALGNRRNVFSKVGDSITQDTAFLVQIGQGNYYLDGYEYLQPVIDYFSRGGINSYAATSNAAYPGWTTFDVLDPSKVFTRNCRKGETPLVCEYRRTRPAVALIMFGTNDVRYSFDPNDYRRNLETIVQTSIDMGIIPVLSTIPDNYMFQLFAERVIEYNGIIKGVAEQYKIPLWDYWLAMQGLPNHGISQDQYHPTLDLSSYRTCVFTQDQLQFGYTMRNLTALMVLDAVWHQALQ